MSLDRSAWLRVAVLGAWFWSAPESIVSKIRGPRFKLQDARFVVQGSMDRVVPSEVHGPRDGAAFVRRREAGT